MLNMVERIFLIAFLARYLFIFYTVNGKNRLKRDALSHNPQNIAMKGLGYLSFSFQRTSEHIDFEISLNIYVHNLLFYIKHMIFER